MTTLSLTRHKRPVNLDNVTLVPASEMASLLKWQEQARSLPSGATLLVLPQHNAHLQQVGKQICLSLRNRGRYSIITTIRSC